MEKINTFTEIFEAEQLMKQRWYDLTNQLRDEFYDKINIPRIKTDLDMRYINNELHLALSRRTTSNIGYSFSTSRKGIRVHPDVGDTYYGANVDEIKSELIRLYNKYTTGDENG